MQVLEYTLFHPGLFLNYLASPYKTSEYVTQLDTFMDFQHRRAIVVEGHEDAIMAFATTQDIAGVVARAVEYEGEWPRNGGIRANRVAVSKVLEIGAKVRGECSLLPVDETCVNRRFQVAPSQSTKSGWRTSKQES